MQVIVFIAFILVGCQTTYSGGKVSTKKCEPKIEPKGGWSSECK